MLAVAEWVAKTIASKDAPSRSSEGLRSPCRHSQRGPHLGSSPDAIPSCKVIDHRTRFAVLLRSLTYPEP
jgi:hypothetical protein